MQEYDVSQFRITLWPGQRQPHPTMLRRSYYLTREGHLRPEPSPQPGWETQWERWHKLRPREDVLEAGEIYLELLELDLDDTEAIVAFCNRWGPLAISYGDPRYGLLRDVPDFWPDVRHRLRGTQPAKHAQRKRPGTTAVPEAESLDEFRYGARCLHDLTTAWTSIRNNTDLTEIAWRSFSPEFIPRHGRSPLGELINVFEGMLTRGLSPFYPQVHLQTGNDQPLRARDEWSTGGTVPLYATCCLELYNHLAEKATHSHCANDKCQRLYVRQTGRAEHGQHRSRGTRYCSAHCARAQAQRNLRARRRTVAAAGPT